MNLRRLSYLLLGIGLLLIAKLGFASPKPSKDAIILESNDSLPDTHYHGSHSSHCSHASHASHYSAISSKSDIDTISLSEWKPIDRISPFTNQHINDTLIKQIHYILSTTECIALNKIDLSIEHKDAFLLLNYMGVSYRTSYSAYIPQNKQVVVIEYTFNSPYYLEKNREIPITKKIYYPIDGAKYAFEVRSYKLNGANYVTQSFSFGDNVYDIDKKFTNSWKNSPELLDIYNLLFPNEK